MEVMANRRKKASISSFTTGCKSGELAKSLAHPVRWEPPVFFNTSIFPPSICLLNSSGNFQARNQARGSTIHEIRVAGVMATT